MGLNYSIHSLHKTQLSQLPLEALKYLLFILSARSFTKQDVI